MNNSELDKIIQRVLSRILSENEIKPFLPKLYILVPDDFANYEDEETINFINSLTPCYKILLIKPDDCNEFGEIDPSVTVINRKDLKRLEKDGLMLLLDLKLATLSKIALLIPDEFESKWALEAIANGNKLFIRRKEILFNEVSPRPFVEKINLYVKTLRDYGVSFNIDELLRNNTAEYGVKSGLNHDVSEKRSKRVITVKDLEKMNSSDVIQIEKGDIITMLAKDRALEKGIKIIYSN